MKKIYLLLGVIFLSLTSLQAQYNFTLAQLQGANNLQNPTSLQFGPDGKLYVSMDVGRIMVYSISKNGNSYSVTNSQTIDLVLAIQNHNDDGSNNNNQSVRQVTGILVVGTASNPVIYVTSSDPRVGGGGTAGDVNLDTNSGVISRLTWNGSSWEKVDIVRGLPRSEENHSNNGLQLDASTNTLYVAVGGSTNAGGPSNNFAFITEYALSAAILKIDLNTINSLPVRGSGNSKYIYDLPTLDDPTRTNISNPDYNPSLPGSPQTIDQGDPWGGNNGRNQARLVENGPVQIHSPGYRNAYDIVITKAPGKEGRMYTIDNGANQGWGGYPKNFNSSNVTNEYQSSEPGSNGSTNGFPGVNNLDNMHLVSKPGMSPIYGGHPTPIRANPDGAGLYYRSGSSGTFSLSPTSDWPPVPSSMADPREGNFYMPGVDDGALTTFTASTNGITEYLSPNYFNAQLVGDIFTADFNGNIWRMKMSNDGTYIVSKEVFASGFGSNPLDITAQTAGQVFDGSIWVADYGSQKIFIFTPDGSSTGNCTGNTTSWSLDDDNDGYKNADEADNGTNPCNPLSFPSDFDGDFVSDKNDTDDDNDGKPDIVDPFHHDATNGLNTPTTILYPFLNGNPGTGLFGMGLTGLMVNNSTDPDALYNPNDPGLIMGGAVGLASFPANNGKASTNQQMYGFQFGYAVSASSPPFSVQSSLIGPFFSGLSEGSLNDNHRHGIFIGTGDQDNFLAIALSGATGGGTPGIRIFGENAGGTTFNTFYSVSGILSASNIFLYLDINPATKVVTARYSTNVNPTIVTLGTFTVTGALATKLQGPDAIAVGLIAHSGTTTTFQAQYDFMNIVTTAPALVNPVIDQEILLGTVSKVISLANVFTDDNGVANLSFSVSGNTNTALIPSATVSGTNLTLTFASNAQGTAKIKIKATDNTGQFAEDEFNVNVSANVPPVAKINAGGPALTQGSWSADQYFSGGNTFGTSDNISNTDNPALYQTERWGNMSCNIPVANGSYTVKLHFAEIFFTTTGKRVFNVSAEGQPMLTNYDIVADAGGGFKAIIKSLTNINVSDGTLNLVFTGVVDNAKISAIEVVPQITANTPPAITNPIPDQLVVKNTVNVAMSLANTFSDNNGVGNLIFTVTGNTNTGLITNAVVNGTNLTLTIASNLTGSSDIKVRATDAQGLFIEDQFRITVTNTPPVATKLINSGGTAVTFSGQTWQADNSYSGGSTFSTTEPIAGTTSDALYQSERFGNFSYSIPVENGGYTVKLHFAEVFFEASNLRKFNVNIENGQGTLTNYDIFAKVGKNVATTEQFVVNVSDGAINISFTSVLDNAKVSAIEIISTTPANTAPDLTTPIPDQVVTGGTASKVISLANVFTDDAGAANMTLSVSGNSNTALVTGAVINGTNLTLTFGNGVNGISTIKVKATDAGGLFVEDEFVVTVTAVNTAPVVSVPIPDQQLISGTTNKVISLSNTFTDNGGPANITLSVTGNTNAALVTAATISGTNLTISTGAGKTGTATIKVKATDSQGLFVEDNFVVTVAANTKPVIVSPYPDVVFGLGQQTSAVINLANVFDDDGGKGNLVLSVPAYTNPAMIPTAQITGTSLTITFAAGVSGASTFRIRATDAQGAMVEDVFILRVLTGPPTVANPIPDQTVTQGTTSKVISIANTFADNGGVANLTYTIAGNTNTAMIPTVTISGTNLTLNFAAGQTGVANVKVKATDLAGLSVTDEFKVTISAPLVPPVVTTPIPDQSVNMNTPSLVLGLPANFSDDGGVANLTFSVSGNTNTALVTSASFSGTNLTLTFAANLTGTANVKVKVTDAQGLFVEDEFKVTVVSIPVVNPTLINAGGPAVTFSGQTWSADKNFNGGLLYSYANAIAGTTNDAIYQTERFGNFNYAVPVTNGSYTVKLHFAECFFSVANARKFNVNIENGQGALTNYDIYAQAGASTAKVETFSTINVTDGTLNITFTSVIDNAKVCAIEIIPNNNTRVAELNASFQANPAADQVLLSWIMPDQQTDILTIEKSRDGVQFEVFETLQTSPRKTVNSGAITDILPYQGVSYYRLKSLGKDGVTRYSLTRSVVFNMKALGFMLYPNPNTTGLVFMEIPAVTGKENLNIRLLTIQGAEVYRQLKADRSSNLLLRMQLPGSITPGTYILEVDQNGKKYHSRLIIN
ncbi:malectin domain-containing carbohydrate-binding protein [Pollutibacter soli]|uniref:malectin domain-containing carbohydrate-binding protein n=1 Tax=Pollutibacter soli TaxID=3034157 RepID=UPI0030135ABB